MKNDTLIKELVSNKNIIVNLEAGLVYSIKSNTPEKPLGAKTKKGYLRTAFYNKGKPFSVMIHRVVWISINDIPPEGFEVNHKNGVKHDNRLSNLELLLPLDNIKHAKDNNLLKPIRGENHYNSKLTLEAVIEIRKMRRNGVKIKIIAGEYKISEQHVSRICNNKRWRLLDGIEYSEYPRVDSSQ